MPPAVAYPWLYLASMLLVTAASSDDHMNGTFGALGATSGAIGLPIFAIGAYTWYRSKAAADPQAPLAADFATGATPMTP